MSLKFLLAILLIQFSNILLRWNGDLIAQGNVWSISGSSKKFIIEKFGYKCVIRSFPYVAQMPIIIGWQIFWVSKVNEKSTLNYVETFE